LSQEETGTREKGGRKVIIEKEGKRMIFWNVAGVIRKDEEFWEYVKEYDYVSLEETWLEGKGWEKLKDWLPTTHEWEMVEARKERIKRRAMGGMLMGKRKGWGNEGKRDWWKGEEGLMIRH